jgi:hypothetical protein
MIARVATKFFFFAWVSKHQSGSSDPSNMT